MSRTFTATGAVRLRCRCSSVKKTDALTNLIFVVPGAERGSYRIDKRRTCELDFNIGQTANAEALIHRQVLRSKLIALGPEAFTRGQSAMDELQQLDGSLSEEELRLREQNHERTKCVVALKLTCKFCGTTHLINPDLIHAIWRARTTGVLIERFELLPDNKAKSRIEPNPKKSRVELILDPDPELRSVYIDGVKTGLSEEDLDFAEKMMRMYLTQKE